MKILEFEELSSTNDYCKAHDEGEDLIVSAARQSGGRGTKGRSFVSGMGGVYLTKMTHYTDFPASDVFYVMMQSAVAVCRTVEDFALTPAVKWPNDVLVGGRKICGILIENVFAGQRLARSIVGIGLNVNNALPQELQKVAVSMREACGRTLDVGRVKSRLTERLNEPCKRADYEKYLSFGKGTVRLCQAGEWRTVSAIGVDEVGRLVIREADGSVHAVSAGEVSLRLREEI